MLVDGKAIAAELLATARARVRAHTAQGAPRLAIITCAPNFETQKYLSA
jgi:5,10-methylene-tetrahydrofolate dehydrogenase/methenyl tetrahydrofolate cyclohydrolase